MPLPCTVEWLNLHAYSAQIYYTLIEKDNSDPNEILLGLAHLKFGVQTFAHATITIPFLFYCITYTVK